MKRSAIRKEDIITLEEFAKEMEVSREVIEGWREKGMPVIKIGKYMRVWRPHVLDWIVSQGEVLNREEREETLFNRKNNVS